MASNVKTLDPVEGLVEYVLDIKPFHTKIVEVLVEYVYGEALDTTFLDSTHLTVDVDHGGNIDPLICIGGFDTASYDALTRFPVISPNASIPFEAYPAINSATNTVIVPGNGILDINVGAQVELLSIVEDFTNVVPLVGLVSAVGSPVPLGGDFIIEGDFTLLYITGYIFQIYGSFANDGFWVVEAPGSTFDGTFTTIPVTSPVAPSAPGGSLGLVTFSGDHTGTYTVANVTFSAGTLDSQPGGPGDPLSFVSGDEPHTIVQMVEAVAPIPVVTPTQTYHVFLANTELLVEDALPYTDQEGTNTFDVVGVNVSIPMTPNTGGFEIASILDANVKVGDQFRILTSTDNDGIYTIASLSYTNSPALTTIGTEEDVTDGTVDGLLRIHIGSNVLIVDGNWRTRFFQGEKLVVQDGSVEGVYNVIRSDFISGKTQIRVLEPLDVNPGGSPAFVPGFIADYPIGYDEYIQLCGIVPEYRMHCAFDEELLIQVSGANDGIDLVFHDYLGITFYAEDVPEMSGAPATGGLVIGAWDFPQWDMDGFEENFKLIVDNSIGPIYP